MQIQILKNENDLCNVLPKEIVPKNYGGEELPLKLLRGNINSSEKIANGNTLFMRIQQLLVH